MFPAVFSQDLGRSFSKHSEKLQENICNVAASQKAETCNKHFLNQRCIQYESIHLIEVGLFFTRWCEHQLVFAMAWGSPCGGQCLTLEWRDTANSPWLFSREHQNPTVVLTWGANFLKNFKIDTTEENRNRWATYFRNEVTTSTMVIYGYTVRSMSPRFVRVDGFLPESYPWYARSSAVSGKPIGKTRTRWNSCAGRPPICQECANMFMWHPGLVLFSASKRSMVHFAFGSLCGGGVHEVESGFWIWQIF